MSGLEILGIVASIVQIADLGATVSVKLCTFYRQVKNADQSVQSLSSDVALTCNILRQLGENLKQDEQTRLCSPQAFDSAQEVLSECEKVFKQINSAIDESRPDPTKGRFQRAARKLGLVLMERDLDVLGSNLERLKSTMLLMLNVIMYAGQLRSRAKSSVLHEQRDLIQVLVEEKKESERRFHQLTKALQGVGINCTPTTAVDELPPYENPAHQDPLPEDLRAYYQLIKHLLQEVDACKSGIEQSRHSRIRNGVVKVHSAEVEQLQLAHGTMVTQLFSDPLFALGEVEKKQSVDDTGKAAKRPPIQTIRRRRTLRRVDDSSPEPVPCQPRRKSRVPLDSGRDRTEIPFKPVHNPDEPSPIFPHPLPRSNSELNHGLPSGSLHRWETDDLDDDFCPLPPTAPGDLPALKKRALPVERSRPITRRMTRLHQQGSQDEVLSDREERPGQSGSKGDNAVNDLVLQWTTLEKDELIC